MILTIIFAIFLIACITLLIILKIKNDPYDITDEPQFILGVILSSIWGIALSITIGISVSQNNDYAKKQETIAIQERIDSINATRNALERKDTISVIEITTYNNEVKELKTDILQYQQALKNPWINWFYNPVWNNYSVDCVSYL